MRNLFKWTSSPMRTRASNNEMGYDSLAFVSALGHELEEMISNDLSTFCCLDTAPTRADLQYRESREHRG